MTMYWEHFRFTVKALFLAVCNIFLSGPCVAGSAEHSRRAHASLSPSRRLLALVNSPTIHPRKTSRPGAFKRHWRVTHRLFSVQFPSPLCRSRCCRYRSLSPSRGKHRPWKFVWKSRRQSDSINLHGLFFTNTWNGSSARKFRNIR